MFADFYEPFPQLCYPSLPASPISYLLTIPPQWGTIPPLRYSICGTLITYYIILKNCNF